MVSFLREPSHYLNQYWSNVILFKVKATRQSGIRERFSLGNRLPLLEPMLSMCIAVLLRDTGEIRIVCGLSIQRDVNTYVPCITRNMYTLRALVCFVIVCYRPIWRYPSGAQYLSKVWNKVTYPFPNFNGSTVEVWEWMSNFILHIIIDVTTYPCWD